jgi:hypothetical protein
MGVFLYRCMGYPRPWALMKTFEEPWIQLVYVVYERGRRSRVHSRSYYPMDRRTVASAKTEGITYHYIAKI